MRLHIFAALVCLANSRSLRPLEFTVDNIPIATSQITCPHEGLKVLARMNLKCKNVDFKTLAATKHWTETLKPFIKGFLDDDEDWYEFQNYAGSGWEITNEGFFTRSGIYTTVKLGPKIVFFDQQKFANQTTTFVSRVNTSIINMIDTQPSSHGTPLKQEDASDFFEIVYCGQELKDDNYELTVLGSFDDDGSGLKMTDLMEEVIELTKLFGKAMTEYCKRPQGYDDQILLMRKIPNCFLHSQEECLKDRQVALPNSLDGLHDVNVHMNDYVVISSRIKMAIVAVVIALICGGSIYYWKGSRKASAEARALREPLNAMRNLAFNEEEVEPG